MPNGSAPQRAGVRQSSSSHESSSKGSSSSDLTAKRRNMLSFRPRSNQTPSGKVSEGSIPDHDYGQDDYHKSEQKKDALSTAEKLERLCSATRQSMSLSQFVLLSIRFLFRCHRLVLVFLFVLIFVSPLFTIISRIYSFLYYRQKLFQYRKLQFCKYLDLT